VDVKVIATTTVDLANLVEQNRFSRQLYTRCTRLRSSFRRCGAAQQHSLAGAQPPASLEKRFSSRLKVDDDALAQLVAYSWPGNDFELNSVIENIAISSDNGHIRLSNLPEYLFPSGRAAIPSRPCCLPA
jgi:transcriptional activator for dhaKLM operon